jgi:hypothetical protein
MLFDGFRCNWMDKLARAGPTAFALDQKPDFRFLANISRR